MLRSLAKKKRTGSDVLRLSVQLLATCSASETVVKARDGHWQLAATTIRQNCRTADVTGLLLIQTKGKNSQQLLRTVRQDGDVAIVKPGKYNL
jgi:hypothetical protein